MCVWLDRLLPKALMTKPKSAGKDGGKGSRGGGLIPEDYSRFLYIVWLCHEGSACFSSRSGI